ncbi:hypothetical protein [Streptomyces sp. FH025]|uniref:hypothetical protein n=1 Tax=Streptomyces sp. FH025 TaxID=2815937 RepID=UPI001A9EF4E0|nr:hypothetical protein [Streptomyces sp. FH025]MBO1418086.1 hypothetical protein [Streptomyces sp. FH025]
MPRPSAARLCLGTFTVVATTVALLAVSGASGVLEVAVLVGLALALGTLVTVFSPSASGHAAGSARGSSGRAEHSPAPAGHGYARQR